MVDRCSGPYNKWLVVGASPGVSLEYQLLGEVSCFAWVGETLPFF